MSQKPVIAYWNLRGLVEPCILLLEYAGVDYEKKVYECGDGPTFDRSGWTDKKYTLGLDFPNLPYYFDGDIKLSESWAILRYIGSKNNLTPESAVGNATAHMLEGVISSFRSGFTSMCYNPNFEQLKPKYIAGAIQKYIEFEKLLKGKAFLCGEKLTYVDFALFETLDQQLLLFPDILDKYDNLKAYAARIESLERVSAYRKSSRFHAFPINNKMAKFGGGKSA